MTPQKWLAMGIVIFVMVVGGALPVFAADATGSSESVGKVVAVRGDVRAVDVSGDSRRLTLKGPVFRDDVLKTGENGRLQVLFADQTLISLGRNTEMEIVRYAWAEDKKSGAMTTRVKEGAFRVMGGAITRNSPENFITETPAATIGVRGSLYAGIIIGDLLSILFQGGAGLDIITPFGSVALTTPGFGCRVAVGGKPSAPGEFEPLDLQLIDAQFMPLDPVTGTESAPLPPPPDGDPSPPPPGVDPLVAAAIETISTTTTTSTQTVLITQATPQPLSFTSGRYLNTLVDDGFWFGPITGVSENGTATGQSVTQDGTVYPISFPFTPYFPTASYTGVNNSFGLSRAVNLRGTDYIFTSMAAHSGTPGEFGYFSTADSFTDGGGTFDFTEFGFAGQESTALPVDGISVYFGEFLGTPKDAGTSALLKARTGGMIMVVNWLNGKVYGFVDEGGIPIMQFFGDVSGNSLTNVTMISDGAEAVGSGVKWHEGTGDFGTFYGAFGQGFGITGLGSTYDIDTQSLLETWRMAGAAFLDTAPKVDFAPTGSITLDGMVVGISEDMTNPNVNRRHFMSHPFAGTTFSMAVDRDAGTMAGQLNAVDLLDPNNVLKNVDIGGANGSAFIDYDVAIAGLGCSTNCVETGATPDTGGLKTYGNYLVADGGPTRAIADHVSWGYWELAYDDPTSGNPYHLHVPFSLWIAGEKTPVADVNAKITSSFTGRYLGRAYGSRIDSANNATELTNGVTDLTIDFNAAALTPVSGTLTFDQANMTVVGVVPVTSGGFQAQIGTATIGGVAASPISTSEVNGFFFEPGAAAMGGNFSAKRVDGEQLLGIMGGDLQP